MFRNLVNSTALTTDIADDFFPIRGNAFNGDTTFLATLRALVAPRMGPDDTLQLVIMHHTYTKRNYENFSSSQRRGVLGEDASAENQITINNFAVAAEDGDTWYNYAEKEFEKLFQGWHRLPIITQFYQKRFPVLCYLNPELRSVYIFTQELSVKNMHYLQCSILAFLPWYFDPSKGVLPLEMELINSLKETTSTHYEDCISKIAQKYNFRELRVRKLLDGIETLFERNELRAREEELVSLRNKLDDLQNRFQELLRQERGLCSAISGLNLTINNPDRVESEIMSYFLSNKNLHLFDVDGTRMRFISTGYLCFFDEHEAERIINNMNSAFYKPDGRSMSGTIKPEDMRALLTEIFLTEDPRIRIKTCAAFELDMGGSVRGIEHFRGYGPESRDCTPNPHIDGYHCMGDYRSAIGELLRRQQYIDAINLCMTSGSSLNFIDYTVCSEFSRRLYGISSYSGSINMRCFELPDGKVVSVKDAIEWLKKEEENG